MKTYFVITEIDGKQDIRGATNNPNEALDLKESYEKYITTQKIQNAKVYIKSTGANEGETEKYYLYTLPDHKYIGEKEMTLEESTEYAIKHKLCVSNVKISEQ